MINKFKLKKNQIGAAILSAMVTVTLVATLTAMAITEQWKNLSVEEAEREQTQARWLLRSALDWSRMLMTMDYLVTDTDNLSEPWANPLAESRLSAFLNAQAGVMDVEDATIDTNNAYFTGEMQDLQGKLNLFNVISKQNFSEAENQIKKLFEKLGLPNKDLDLLLTNLRAARTNSNARVLISNRIADLSWFNLSESTINELEKYATLIYAPTKININTASAQVIYASSNLEWGQVNTLVSKRSLKFFKNILEAQASINLTEQNNKGINTDNFGVTSEFFLARGQIRMDNVALAMQAGLYRKDSKTRTLYMHTSGKPLIIKE